MDRALNVFFNFNGRLRRVPFVLSIVASVVVAFIITSIWIAAPFDPMSVAGRVEMVLILTFVFIYSWATLALAAKRLHDVGQSGWMLGVLWLPLMFPILVPTIGVSVVSWAANLAIFAALSLVPGTKGENRWG